MADHGLNCDLRMRHGICRNANRIRKVGRPGRRLGPDTDPATIFCHVAGEIGRYHRQRGFRHRGRDGRPRHRSLASTEKEVRPQTDGTFASLLISLVSFKITKSQDVQSELVCWETILNAAERDRAEKLSPEIRRALLLNILPSTLQSWWTEPRSERKW